MTKKRETRYRNFATIIYPESSPSNFIEILEDFKISMFISPLHDSDYEATGEFKKPHYHLVIMYQSVKTIQQAKEIIDTVSGVGVEPIHDIRAYSRYLCHLDSYNKAKYDVAEVIELSGADYNSVISLPSDRYSALREMMEYIRDYNIIYFSDLMIYSMEQRHDWYKVLCDSGSYVIEKFIKSYAYKNSNIR